MDPQSTKWYQIVLAGSIGGLLAWLFIVTAPGYRQEDWFLPLLLSLMAGALAAGGGVYLIANTDTSHFPRTIFFAALCGVFWAPMFDTLKEMVVNTQTNRPAAAATEDLEKALMEVKREATPQSVSTLANKTKLAAAKLAHATDFEVKSAGWDRTLEAVALLKHLDETKPGVKAEAEAALQSLGANPVLPGEVRRAAAENSQ